MTADELARNEHTVYVFSLEITIPDPTSKRTTPRKAYMTLPIVGPSDEPLVVALAARQRAAKQCYVTTQDVVARSYTMLYGPQGLVQGMNEPPQLFDVTISVEQQ